MSFGIKTAPSEFNRILDQILLGLEGVSNYSDDIMIYGSTKAECYARLIATLDRLSKNNLHLNAKKCAFLKEEISFSGHVVKHNCIHKDPEKVKAVLDIPAAKDESQL